MYACRSAQSLFAARCVVPTMIRRFRNIAIGVCGACLLATLIGCHKDEAPIAATDRISQAWDFYRMAEYTLAVRYFEVASTDPQATADQRLEALYGLGNVWNLRTPEPDIPKARQYFQQVVDTGGDSTWAAWSLLALAQIERLTLLNGKINVEKTSAAYQRVVDRFPNHPAGEEAFLSRQFLQITTFKPADIEKSITELKHFTETHPNSDYLSAAYTLLANAYEEQKRYPDFLAMLIMALKSQKQDATDPTAESVGLLWKIASVAEFKVGDFATARTYYQKLIDEYPIDSRRYAARRALERIARIEAALKQNPDAPISND